MKSSFARQFSLTAGMILISFLVLGIGFISLVYNSLMSERKSALANSASSVAQLAAAYSSTGELAENWDLSISLTFAAQVSGTEAIICDGSGAVLVCSCQEPFCSHMEKTVDSQYISAVLSGQEFCTSGTLGGVYSTSRLIYGLPLESSSTGESIGVVFSSYEAEDITEMVYRFASIFLLSALVVLALAFIVTSIIAQNNSKPIRDMAQAARRFGKGELSVRVQDYHRSDDIGELTTAFNSMAMSLENNEINRREFVANVSHELKTPMTTISGYVDGILDGTIPPEQQEHYLKIVSDETKRLSRLVRKMLELSRIQDGTSVRTDKFDISELLGQVLLSFEGKINAKSLSVDAQLSEDPMMVTADYDGITQVVYNLLDNGVKFSDPGSQLGVHLEKQGGKAFVSIINHGQEIPPQELPRIFERFHKTDRSRSTDRDGWGLGLYIVKTIINALGEDITVTSQNGETNFSFTLTLAGKNSK